jgi:hypothetical protein
VRSGLAGRLRRHRVLTTLAGGVVAIAVLAYVIADRRDEFGAALTAAPVWILVVDASLFDATAVLIAMVTLAQLPIGPSVGAAAVVLILGANGAALAAAAGVLLTATGTAGALAFATWAGLDRLWTLRPAVLRPVTEGV